MFKFAVLGCGYWGPNLLRNLVSLEESEVKLVCDTNVERLAHMKELYRDIETTTNFDDVINDPDIGAVVVATPVRFHFDMARQCLQAGKHTFIEKPMARSSEECEQLIAMARKQGLTLMVGHTFIYSAAVMKLKEIVNSGQLGQIQHISSKRLNLGLFQKDINVAWDLAPHDISILLYLLDEMPISVNCQGKAHVARDVEDITNMTLNYADSVIATIESSWLHPNKARETVIVGTEKMLVYNDLEPTEKIKVYDKRVEIPPYYDTFGEFQYSYHYGDVYSPYIKLIEPLRTECEHFMECILTGSESASGGNEGLKVVQILEASSASLKNDGGPVKIADLAETIASRS